MMEGGGGMGGLMQYASPNERGRGGEGDEVGTAVGNSSFLFGGGRG